MATFRVFAGGTTLPALGPLAVALVLLRAAAGPAGADDTKPDELAALKGSWTVKAETFDGDEVPAALAGQCSFVFGDGSVTLKGGLAKAGDTYVAVPGEHTFTLKVGASEAGKTIDLTGGAGGRTVRGLYKVEKGKLTLVLNFAAGERPARFEAPAGANGIALFVCEKKDD
jgi:uncharacterized protein (TIGR03067 family)